MTKPAALTEADIASAACALQCEVAAIKAIVRKEVRGSGFLADGQPAILFERHIFHRLTAGRFGKTHPHISSGAPGGYGASGQHQHDRLAVASKLDRAAALQAASWGCFQILGANWRQCGFDSLQDFINAMYRSERAHLDAFVRFIQNERRTFPLRGEHKGMTLLTALRNKVWSVFAYIYNGKNYAINDYDASLKRYYDEAPAGDKRVPDVSNNNDPMGGAT